MKIKFYIILFLSIFGNLLAEEYDSLTIKRNFSLYLNAGISSDLDSIAKHSDRTGIAISIRFMWEPEHLLKVGVETSLLNITSFKQKNADTEFGKTDIDNKLRTIPILMIAEMELWDIGIIGGYGPAYVYSEINAFDESSVSGEWDYCLMAGLNYSYLIYDKFYIDAEAKYYTLPELFKNLISFQAGIKYSF